MSAMYKKSKEELKPFWENTHVNDLTLHMRDKLRLFEKLDSVKHLLHCHH